MADLILPSLWETLYMVFFFYNIFFNFRLPPPGNPTGYYRKGWYLGKKTILNNILNGIINIFRSFPFIILMILLFPLSRVIVGSTIGTTATIVPLSIAAAPFVARVIESS